MSQHFSVLLPLKVPSITAFLLLLSLQLIPGCSSAAEIGTDTFFPFADKAVVSGKNKSKDKGEWQALDEHMTAIESQMEGQEADEEQLRLWINEVSELKSSVDAYIEILQTQFKQLENELTTLGEPVENEAKVLTEQRNQKQQQKAELSGLLSGYKLLSLHAEELVKKMTVERQRVLTEKFLSRGPGTLQLLKEDAAVVWRWPVATVSYSLGKSGLQSLDRMELSGLGAVLIAALVLGFILRKKIIGWSEKTCKADYRFASVLLDAVGHYSPHLLFALVLAVFVAFSFPDEPRPFLYRFAVMLPLFFISWAVLHFMFIGRKGSALFQLPRRVARGFARSFKTLVLLFFSGNLIFISDIARQMTEAERFLVQDLFVISIVLVLLWALYYFRLILHEKGIRGIFGLLFLALFTTLVGELLGYRNLSYWVLRALIGTVLFFGLFWLSARLLAEFFEGLQSGQIWWQRSLRQLFGYGIHEQMPWLVWVRGMAHVALWLAFAHVVLRVWGVSAETLDVLYGYFFTGFPIGSLTVIPARIVVAVLMFAALLAFSGWVRKSLETRWLVSSRMERGTREAMVTMSGYVGAAVAILVALSVAGVQFTNLAIIAGALSVGIGFGLQNIVNNFISGLILLFERPVKTGDWIMVGSTEGYVKRISIRSTLIQTFDRADVIVPNSELISGQVTNWMLYDPRGRVKVPIGVAYGSDTGLVKDILLRIAEEHPRVISDGSVSEPKVLFMSFGDSSLNFELRAFIQNIDERLQVVSDINFAIDAAFREYGIEIPFPQRDLHVRSWQNPPSTSES